MNGIRILFICSFNDGFSVTHHVASNDELEMIWKNAVVANF